MGMVNTIYGMMDTDDLEFKTGTEEDDDKTLTWVEYWKDGELVHRSVDMVLKRGIDFGFETGIFG